MNLWRSLQTLSEVDDSLREFELKVAEFRSTADRLQLDQTSKQELLKLQVIGFFLFPIPRILYPFLIIWWMFLGHL